MRSANFATALIFELAFQLKLINLFKILYNLNSDFRHKRV